MLHRHIRVDQLGQPEQKKKKSEESKCRALPESRPAPVKRARTGHTGRAGPLTTECEEKIATAKPQNAKIFIFLIYLKHNDGVYADCSNRTLARNSIDTAHICGRGQKIGGRQKKEKKNIYRPFLCEFDSRVPWPT